MFTLKVREGFDMETMVRDNGQGPSGLHPAHPYPEMYWK